MNLSTNIVISTHPLDNEAMRQLTDELIGKLTNQQIGKLTNQQIKFIYFISK